MWGGSGQEEGRGRRGSERGQRAGAGKRVRGSSRHKEEVNLRGRIFGPTPEGS